MIIIDSNHAETFMFQEILDANITVERQRLDVGDVILSFEDSDYIIERKTWNDLISSICDGRWSDQKKRMLQANDDDNKKKQYAYIIEGELTDWVDGGRSKMNQTAVWAALIKTQVRDNIHIFHTKDKLSSVQLILYLHKQFKTNGFETKLDRTITGLGVNKRKRDNLSSPESLYTAMLTIIPGMSKQKADTITASFPTVLKLTTANEQQIAELKCNDRKIGHILAKKIHETFCV